MKVKPALDALRQMQTDTKGRRIRRPSLSEQEFLDKVLDLLLEQGFERTTIEAITSAAGMAKRTFYLRYESKEALLEIVLQREIERWFVPVERLKSVECGDLEESLLEIGRILVANVLSPAWLRLLRLTHAESGRALEIATKAVLQGSIKTVAYLADYFRRHMGMDKASFPEAEDLADAFLNLVVASPSNLIAWGVSLSEESIERRTRFRVSLFLHGFPDRQRSNAHKVPNVLASPAG